MTAGQRLIHARVWTVLGAMILLGLIAAVASRPDAAAPGAAASRGAPP